MKYKENIYVGRFIKRPNRFIAHIEMNGIEEKCHVKNTGRCKELLPEGATVYCADCLSPTRKTRYDLIAVQKGNRIINMDSQAPNAAVYEWLKQGGLGNTEDIKPETTFGDSRFDFSFKKDGKLCFLEVKGVTLENDNICAFPDAPTERGVKHLKELSRLSKEGYETFVMFVIQMEQVTYLHPNDETDPEFGKALRNAAEAGVQIMAYDCKVTPDSLTIHNPVPVKL